MSEVNLIKTDKKPLAARNRINSVPQPDAAGAQKNKVARTPEDLLLEKQNYKYGFVSPVKSHRIPKGLNEEVIEDISARKKEPDWVLNLRLKAYRHWLTLTEPKWARLKYPPH